MRFRLWLFFSVFSLTILGAVWFSQVIFIERTYTLDKKNSVDKLGRHILSNSGMENLNSYIFEKSFGNDIYILIVDGEGNVVIPTEISLSEKNKLSKKLFDTLIVKINDSQSGQVSYTNREENLSYVFGAKIKIDNSVNYLYVSSPLQPLKNAISILKFQLLIITTVVVLLGFLVSVMFSSNITRPVRKMAHSAKRLAQRDYSVEFEGSSYSEIDQLAKALNYAKSELMKSDEQQRQLIANVSHDLRTPLTMIKAYAEMIVDLDADNKEKRQRNVKIIVDETDRLTELVNDILSVSKAGENLNNLNLEVVVITQLVESIVENFRYLKEYDFVLDLEKNALSRIDLHKIKQVIYNLVANAVNYTGEDKRIYITLYKADGHARLEVKDTGGGIPEDLIGSIWDRYSRSVETHKRPTCGSGLGLSIAKSILQAHNFNYGVNSTLNSGSTFYVDFPLI